MKKDIIPPISKEVKDKFLKEVIIDHDMIQESTEDDELFRGETALRWQLRGFIEWQRSPCIEHKNTIPTTRENCPQCRKICVEALRS